MRLWRELLAGTTAMQGPFAVAVCEPDGGAGFTQAAREHFGALTPLRAYGSPAQAMAEVSRGSAAVAVLPVPSETEPPGTPGGPRCCRRTSRGCTWWRGCRSGRRGRMARRPSQALVIATTEPDPSRSATARCSASNSIRDVSRARLTAALTAAGLRAGGDDPAA